MKKLLTLLLLATFFVGCSSDDDGNNQSNYTELKADQVVGSYELASFVDDKGNFDPIDLTKENILEFKSDYSGKIFSLKEQKDKTFTWSINNGKIIFNVALLGNAQCTLENKKLTMKAKSEFSGNMGTYIYHKN